MLTESYLGFGGVPLGSFLVGSGRAMARPARKEVMITEVFIMIMGVADCYVLWLL